jgi:hypothetical protein
MEIMNRIKVSLLDLERHCLSMVDCRIDGNTYLERANKYKNLTREENINSAMERRNFVHNKMTVLLREYLYKCSLKEKTGRENIHHCNYASAVKVLNRMSENETSPTPDPPFREQFHQFAMHSTIHTTGLFTVWEQCAPGASHSSLLDSTTKPRLAANCFEWPRDWPHPTIPRVSHQRVVVVVLE